MLLVGLTKQRSLANIPHFHSKGLRNAKTAVNTKRVFHGFYVAYSLFIANLTHRFNYYRVFRAVAYSRAEMGGRPPSPWTIILTTGK